MLLTFLFSPLAGRGGEAQFGPFYHEFKLTLTPGHREEALGPFFYHQEVLEEWGPASTWAVPPLFSRRSNDEIDFEQLDILWKLITYNRYGTEYRFQLLQWFNFTGGGSQSETSVSRVTLFPIYFHQRSASPDMDYTAVFPIYGEIRGRFFRDEIHFVLFPLYGQSRKKDVVTDNYLYPIFHLRHGDGLKGWQFWPLFGVERKEVTFRTNHWGDAVTVPGHDKQFILWPLFSEQYTAVGTTNPAHHHALIPLYSLYRSPRRTSTSIPWPIGYTHTVDLDRKYEEWGAPWPLIVFARGEGKHVNRVWPFYSRATNAHQTSFWCPWLIYKYNRLHNAPLDRERRRVLLFLYSDTSVKNTADGTRQRQFDLFPLFTSRREFDGRHRLQVLSILEPFLPNNTSVQRNLSPLWSIWRAEKNPKTGASSQSLLWNLYRRDVTPETKKCSLLFGLFRYQSGPEGRRAHVFFIPFGKKPQTARDDAP